MTLRDVLRKEPIVIAPCAYDVVTAQFNGEYADSAAAAAALAAAVAAAQ